MNWVRGRRRELVAYAFAAVIASLAVASFTFTPNKVPYLPMGLALIVLSVAIRARMERLNQSRSSLWIVVVVLAAVLSVVGLLRWGGS